MDWFKALSKIRERKRPSQPIADTELQQEQLHSRLDDTIQTIKNAFGNSNDLAAELFDTGPGQSVRLGLIYMKGLTDAAYMHERIREPLMLSSREAPDSVVSDTMYAIRKILEAAGKWNTVKDFSELYDSILSGMTVVLVDGHPAGLSTDTKGGNDRAVEEPSTQSVVRGPREGFTETMDTNIALLRKRIKSPNLWLESMVIGEITRTGVGIMFVKGIVNDKIVDEVRARLKRIDIDGILESGNVEELIQDATFTLFPTIYNSERPDVIAAGLLEGRVAVLVDGTPFVLLAPALFVQFFQSAEDYYQRADFASLIRVLRYVCFFISLLAPSFYIAITTFHQELIPSTLLLSLAAQREGIPFPAFVEAMVMEVTFEILREAGVRLPKTVGQAVSIVGALVIGQAAVEAGLVSPGMVIIVAITAISNFVIPAFNMAISIRILRFLLMIVAATFGLFGVTIGLLAMVQHLCGLRSFGVPYMSPMAPYNTTDQKDTILRLPLRELFTRPRFISGNRIRGRNDTPQAKAKPERSQS